MNFKIKPEIALGLLYPILRIRNRKRAAWESVNTENPPSFDLCASLIARIVFRQKNAKKPPRPARRLPEKHVFPVSAFAPRFAPVVHKRVLFQVRTPFEDRRYYAPTVKYPINSPNTSLPNKMPFSLSR